MEKPIISSDDIRKIFSNVEVLYGLSTKLLMDLEAQGVDGDIGQVFCEFAFFKMYDMYLTDSVDGIDLVEELLRRNDRFARHCVDKGMLVEGRRGTEGRGESMRSLLVKPVQRLTRYRLLIKELLKFTCPSEPEHQNERALEAALRVETSIDKCDNMMEAAEKAGEAQALRDRFRSSPRCSSRRWSAASSGRATSGCRRSSGASARAPSSSSTTPSPTAAAARSRTR